MQLIKNDILPGLSCIWCRFLPLPWITYTYWYTLANLPNTFKLFSMVKFTFSMIVGIDIHIVPSYNNNLHNLLQPNRTVVKNNKTCKNHKFIYKDDLTSALTSLRNYHGLLSNICLKLYISNRIKF